MERKLASVQVVKDVYHAENSDNLDVAVVNNWRAVVARDKFKAGDVVVFFETDAFLPVQPQYEFLRGSSFKKLTLPNDEVIEGFRLKTVRLRGNISQGLVMPINELLNGDYEVGDDVTNELGVVLYDPPDNTSIVSGDAKGPFPSFLVKSSAERWQNITVREPFNAHVTEKIDGTSVTYYNWMGEFGTCSRNLEVKPGSGVYWEMAEYYGLRSKVPEGFALQGEIYGQGIQSNRLGVPRQFAIYGIFNIAEQRYTDFPDVMAMCSAMDLQSVPLIYYSVEIDETKLEALAEEVETAHSVISPTRKMEGFVLWTDMPRMQRIKILSKSYELKGK
jgi:RNA ligase (TIGR02306 family)